jgi:hypothetical protein
MSLAFFFILGAILVYYGLGSITFVLWIFVAVWMFGLRDKFSTETTASAYSVFNKGGRSIVGGLTKDQLEGQLRGSLRTADTDDAATGTIPEHSQSVSISGYSKNSRLIQSHLPEAEREKRRKASAVAAERRHKEA